MKNQIKLLTLVFSLLTLVSLSRAQGSQVTAMAQVGGGVPNASVTVCNGGPISTTVLCSTNQTKATLYADETLSLQISNPITADSAGNYSYYLSSGVFTECVSSSITALYCHKVVVPISSVGGLLPLSYLGSGFVSNGTVYYDGTKFTSSINNGGVMCWQQANGNAPTWGACNTGVAASAWDTLTNPTGNQSLSMGNHATQWTFGSNTLNPSFMIQDTTGNASGNPIVQIQSVGTSTSTPLQLSTGSGTGTTIKADKDIQSQTRVYGGLITLAFSATPTFDLSKGNGFKIILTGNVTSSTLSNLTSASFGQNFFIEICQDATGGRSFVWPGNIIGGRNPSIIANACTTSDFWTDGSNAYITTISELENPTGNGNIQMYHVDGIRYTSMDQLVTQLPATFRGIIYEDIDNDTWTQDELSKFQEVSVVVTHMKAAITLSAGQHCKQQCTVNGQVRGFPGSGSTTINGSTFLMGTSFPVGAASPSAPLVLASTATCPASGNLAGGNLPAGTYSVGYAWDSNNGPTDVPAATIATIVMDGAHCIQVTHPTTPAVGTYVAYHIFACNGCTPATSQDWIYQNVAVKPGTDFALTPITGGSGTILTHSTSQNDGPATVNLSAMAFYEGTGATTTLIGGGSANIFEGRGQQIAIKMYDFAVDCQGSGQTPGQNPPVGLGAFGRGAFAVMKGQENAGLYNVAARNCGTDGVFRVAAFVFEGFQGHRGANNSDGYNISYDNIDNGTAGSSASGWGQTCGGDGASVCNPNVAVIFVDQVNSMHEIRSPTLLINNGVTPYGIYIIGTGVTASNGQGTVIDGQTHCEGLAGFTKAAIRVESLVNLSIENVNGSNCSQESLVHITSTVTNFKVSLVRGNAGATMFTEDVTGFTTGPADSTCTTGSSGNTCSMGFFSVATVNGIATRLCNMLGCMRSIDMLNLTSDAVGTGSLVFNTSPSISGGFKDANGNSMLQFTPTASAVDALTVTNSATGTPGVVKVGVAGSDADIALEFDGKGSGSNIFQKIIIGQANKVFEAGDVTDANSTTNLQAITALAWTFPKNTNLTMSFHCSILWSQGSGPSAVAFGIGAPVVAPSNIAATGVEFTNTTTSTYGALPTLSTTTATNIVSATPNATGTVYITLLDGTAEFAANATAPQLGIFVSQATAANTVTIKRGSYCEILP